MSTNIMKQKITEMLSKLNPSQVDNLHTVISVMTNMGLDVDAESAAVALLDLYLPRNQLRGLTVTQGEIRKSLMINLGGSHPTTRVENDPREDHIRHISEGIDQLIKKRHEDAEHFYQLLNKPNDPVVTQLNLIRSSIIPVHRNDESFDDDIVNRLAKLITLLTRIESVLTVIKNNSVELPTKSVMAIIEGMLEEAPEGAKRSIKMLSDMVTDTGLDDMVV